MSPAASLRAQLASIMEVLTQSAVSEICALLDGTYSLLRLELSRSRKENELLRRKLRTSALRTSTRVQLAATRPTRLAAPRGKTLASPAWPQEAPRCRVTLPLCGPVSRSVSPVQTSECVVSSKLVETTLTRTVKVEDDSEAWIPADTCDVNPPIQLKQEVVDVGVSRKSSEDQDPPGTSSVNTTAQRRRPAVFAGGEQEAPLPKFTTPVIKKYWSMFEEERRLGAHRKSYCCEFCGKTLACLKNLKTHMRVHTGEKPFVCPLCGKRFSDSSNLKRHQSVHTGEKRYSCSHCGKRFAQSGSLKVHMSVHSDCSQFNCSFCGKTFISGSHLRRHLATTHHTSAPQ
ncbi:uncharacterized protein ACB058_015446 [Synchiropus picturatus]